MHNFEERIQEPVKKFSQSLYGHMVVAGGVVVNRMTTRSVIIIILAHYPLSISPLKTLQSNFYVTPFDNVGMRW